MGTLPFSLGAIGGGDVKLLAACACVFGLSAIVPLVLYTAVIGGVVALLALAWRKSQPEPQRVVVPYAVAIAGAVLWLSLADTYFPKLRVM